MANGALHSSGMSSNLEPLGPGSSLTARRPAANSLPSFELPPPQPLQSRYLSYSATQSQPPSAPVNVSSLSNLLTPPTQMPGDSHSPLSAGGHSGNSPTATNGTPSYGPNSYWPPTGPGANPFSLGSGTIPQSWGQGSMASTLNRPMFSPHTNVLARNNSNSPSASEGLPHPPHYDLSPLPPPFPPSIPMSTSAHLSNMAGQQAAPQGFINPQNPVSSATTQPAQVVHSSEHYLQRPPPTPSYYNPSQTSASHHQSQYASAYANDASVQGPLGGPHQGARMSPVNGQLPNLQPPSLPLGNGYVRPYPPYPLPPASGANMANPIMSNVHNPGAQMHMVGGGMPGGVLPTFNSGHSAQLQQLYGGANQAPPNDRPFKCDQCPQSFNRNHDLKRHKRIHLAVKPFPCGNCEKSFSRKDALKVSFLRP